MPVDPTDVVLESIRTLILIGLIVFLMVQGRKRKDLSRRGWNLILLGLLVILFGCILDITDEFSSLNRYVFIGDTKGQAFLEKMVGELGGFLLLAIGLQRWIPTVTKVEENEAALRQSHQDLRKLAGKLIMAHEEERRIVARELHDDFTQRLAALAIEAGKMEQRSTGLPEQDLQQIQGIKARLITLSEDLQGTSRQLHPAVLEDLGLVAAIESDCARFIERENIKVEFSSRDVPEDLSKQVSFCLYRVVQESMRNIAKHARTERVWISLVKEGSSMCLTVRDAGIGFDPAQVRRMGSLGLSSMEERVRLVEGDIMLKSQPGNGTTIEVRVPISLEMV